MSHNQYIANYIELHVFYIHIISDLNSSLNVTLYSSSSTPHIHVSRCLSIIYIKYREIFMLKASKKQEQTDTNTNILKINSIVIVLYV